MRSLRLLVATLAALPAVLLVPAAAQAQSADAQGWWNELHQTGAPAPPAPPDLADNDLLLQGGDAFSLLPSGTVDMPAQPSALAALRFTVDPAASVGALTLSVAAGAKAMAVRAYPTAPTWKAEQNGAYAEAPKPDLVRFADGALSADGLSLVFPDISRLETEGGSLSFVIYPGAADRVVIHHPDAKALTVTPASAPGVVPAAGAPAPAAPLPPPVHAVLPPLAAPLDGGVAPLAPAAVPAQPAPALAPEAALPLAAAPNQATALRPVSQLLMDDSRTRVLVGLEALIVVVFFGLLGQGPLRLLARWTGAAEPEADAERGIGRFTAARTGSAPRL
jgi:hypothetical protein